MYAHYLGTNNKVHRTRFGIDLPVFETDERAGIFKRRPYSSYSARGRYGLVEIALKEMYGMVAIKTLFNEIDISSDEEIKINLRDQLERELIPTIFDHPSIIKILGVGADRPQIIMDYCPYTLTARNPDAAYKRKFATLFQIASAMELMHRQGIVHLDIKSDNILFSDEGIAVLCDFSRSIHISDRLIYRECLDKQLYLHCSPELLNGEAVDIFSDIFSFGILAYRIFLKTKLEKRIGKLKLDGNIPHLYKFTPNEDPLICHLLSRCVSSYKNERPTAAQLKKELEYFAINER